MPTSRRHLLRASALGGMGLAIGPLLKFDRALAASPASAPAPGATGELMATSGSSFFRPYRSRLVPTPEATTWVQIDLGSSQSIDAVKLYPFCRPHWPAGDGFPLRFRIDCSDDIDFGTRTSLVNWTRNDYPDPESQIVEFAANRITGRYVRLTATRLRTKKPSKLLLDLLPEGSRKSYRDLLGQSHFLALSKLEVLAKGTDLALGRPVTVDRTHGNEEDAQQLTRAPRPQGEGMITDNPQNITLARDWRPAANRALTPLGGVELRTGLFKSALDHNIRYLLDSFTADDMLRPFRERAGKPLQPAQRVAHPMWEEALAGSNAGRFLMGAANTLRWTEHAELRSRLNSMIDVIAECREPDGYLMAYPEDTFFYSERGAYTRAWVTQGLIDAGYTGNAKAFELLRDYYDWYNRQSFLPQALRRCNFGPQGTVANTRMYFTPVGKPTDLQVVQRYMQENYWLDSLAARKLDALWQYPYDRTHCYLINFMEPYLDLYRATGEQRYLEAALGGWDLVRENWQNAGGTISLQEMYLCPPKAYPLYESRGETCGSAFWILLNQRLHLLYPQEEKYVAEIEKSIYNVLLANQAGSQGIRYHTRLVEQKERPRCTNTCCEGQGTRILGSLPEYIYSIAADGIYVNLFEPSSIRWQQGGTTLQLEMHTDFPRSPQVRLELHAPAPVATTINIRTPGWAAGVMNILVNGQPAATGTPGSFVALSRQWSDGDTISFSLPLAFKLTKYPGIDQIAGRERFSLEYGPLLMAALGAADAIIAIEGNASPAEAISRLQPKPGQPLHFVLPMRIISAETVWVPYFEIQEESFSCFPCIQSSDLL